jgi:hypothetical protein
MELAMVMVIVGIVGATSAVAVLESMRLYGSSMPRMEGTYQADLLLQRLRGDVRALADSSTVTSLLPERLGFERADGETVDYTFAGGDLTRNGQRLATAFSGFRFGYLTDKGGSTTNPSELRLLEVEYVLVRGGEKLPGYALVHPRGLER